MQIQDTKKTRINGENLKITIILPYFNDKIGLNLLKNTINELKQNKVQDKNIKTIRVEGALEIPFACQKIIEKQKPDAIIALGVVIKGETSHYDLVTKSTFEGLMKVQLKSKTPISFGILTCENAAQAKKRASAKGQNKGAQAAKAAIIQATL